MFEGFIEHFSILPDPRVDRTKKHNLIDILFIGVSTTICGGEGFTDMEDFATAKEDWLRKYLELPGGIPSHDTFRRVFSVIDPDAFQTCFARWTQTLHEATNGEVIALDGKTIRHSFDTASGQPALHIVSAWASENGLALGHVKVDDKSNEITALPKLLEMLDIKGRTVTMDAMGCQKELAEQIVDKGGDYVLCVKGNQGSLHEDVAWFFDECEDFKDVEHTYYESVEKDHGRIEIRKCWAVEGEAKWLGFGEEWKGLRSIAALRAERIIRGVSSKETRYYISSLPGEAQKIASAVREHWAIENSLHYVLDVTLNEDMSRVRKDNAPENLATLRRIAVNMVKKDKTPMKGRPSIRRAMKRAAYLNNSLEHILVS
jgi:predicted transposase YbfD/YdcC